MERVCIELSLENVWRSFRAFRKGKYASEELIDFEYYLEQNLFQLADELQKGRFQPGVSRTFMVSDNKRRKISVSPVRDRVVHRLLYDYLVPLYDHTFIYDVWSCRKGKGLDGAVERTQKFLAKYPKAYVWRSDITKFFDSVNRQILFSIISEKIKDLKALLLLKCLILNTDRGG